MSSPALNDLNPIITAPAASWWPLAPGWYFVVFLALTLCIWLVVISVRSIRRRRVRRAAMRALHADLTLNEVNLLLKQACFGYYPRGHVAHLSGQAWRDFLLDHLSERKAATYYDLLVEVEQSAYRPAAEQEPLQQRYQAFAKNWLRHALPPGKAQRRPRS